MSRTGKSRPRDPEQYEITRKNYEYLMKNKDTIKIKLLQKPFGTFTTWVYLSVLKEYKGDKILPVISFTNINDGVESEIVLLGSIKEYHQHRPKNSTNKTFQLGLQKCKDDYYMINDGMGDNIHESFQKEVAEESSSSSSSEDDNEDKSSPGVDTKEPDQFNRVKKIFTYFLNNENVEVNILKKIVDNKFFKVIGKLRVFVSLSTIATHKGNKIEDVISYVCNNNCYHYLTGNLYTNFPQTNFAIELTETGQGTNKFVITECKSLFELVNDDGKIKVTNKKLKKPFSNLDLEILKEIDIVQDKSNNTRKLEDVNSEPIKKQDIDEDEKDSQIRKPKTGPKQDKELVEYNEKLFQYLMENKDTIKIKNLKHPRVGWICLSAWKNSEDIVSFVAEIDNIQKEYTLKGYFVSNAKKITIGFKIEKNDDHYIITKGGKDCFPYEVETTKEPHSVGTTDKLDKKRGRKESELENIDFGPTKKQDIDDEDVNDEDEEVDEDEEDYKIKKSKKGSRIDSADNLLNVRKCCEYLINNPNTNIKVLQKFDKEDFEGRYKISKLFAFLTIIGGYDDVISFDTQHEDGTSVYHRLAGRLVKYPRNGMNFTLGLKETSKDSNIFNVKVLRCKYEITKNPNGSFVIGEKLMKKYYSNIDEDEVVRENREFSDQTFGKLLMEPQKEIDHTNPEDEVNKNSKKREREVVEVINPEPLKKQDLHQQFELGQCVEVEYTGSDILYKDVLYSAIYNQSLGNDRHRCSIPVFTGREQPQYIWQSNSIHIPTQTNIVNKFVIGETVIIPMQRKLFNEYGEDIDGFSQVWIKGIIVSAPNLYVFNIEHTAWDKNDPNKKLIQSFNTNSIRKNY